MQEINPSVKNTLIDTSNYLNDIATIYNKCIEETKKKIITAEGIRISDLVKEPAPEAILFEVLHPLDSIPHKSKISPIRFIANRASNSVAKNGE